MKTSDVKTEVITTKNYEIQYWMNEEYREGFRKIEEEEVLS
jgi:hypothetical protein